VRTLYLVIILRRRTEYANSEMFNMKKDLDISHNTNLRTIQIDLFPVFNSNLASRVSWAYSVLSQISSSHILEVVLQFIVFTIDNLQLLDWNRLETIFARPQFSDLQGLKVGLMGVDMEEAGVIIRKKLPLCDARGILKFDHCNYRPSRGSPKPVPFVVPPPIAGYRSRVFRHFRSTRRRVRSLRLLS
jgi:hypothetical protein